MLPRRRGEQAPERSNGQSHEWRAGSFCFRKCWKRFPSTIAGISVDAFPCRTAIGVRAAVPTWLLDERCRNGAAIFQAVCRTRLHPGFNYTFPSCVSGHTKFNVHATFTVYTVTYSNFHFALDKRYIDVQATSAKIRSSILVHATFAEASLRAICPWRELRRRGQQLEGCSTYTAIGTSV